MRLHWNSIMQNKYDTFRARCPTAHLGCSSTLVSLPASEVSVSFATSCSPAEGASPSAPSARSPSLSGFLSAPFTVATSSGTPSSFCVGHHRRQQGEAMGVTAIKTSYGVYARGKKNPLVKRLAPSRVNETPQGDTSRGMVHRLR